MKSEIRNQKSEIRNQKSEIRNHVANIYYLKLEHLEVINKMKR